MSFNFSLNFSKTFVPDMIHFVSMFWISDLNALLDFFLSSNIFVKQTYFLKINYLTLYVFVSLCVYTHTYADNKKKQKRWANLDSWSYRKLWATEYCMSFEPLKVPCVLLTAKLSLQAQRACIIREVLLGINCFSPILARYVLDFGTF